MTKVLGCHTCDDLTLYNTLSCEKSWFRVAITGFESKHKLAWICDSSKNRAVRRKLNVSASWVNLEADPSWLKSLEKTIALTEILIPSLVISLWQRQCMRLSLFWIIGVKIQNCHLRQIASSKGFFHQNPAAGIAQSKPLNLPIILFSSYKIGWYHFSSLFA